MDRTTLFQMPSEEILPALWHRQVRDDDLHNIQRVIDAANVRGRATFLPPSRPAGSHVVDLAAGVSQESSRLFWSGLLQNQCNCVAHGCSAFPWIGTGSAGRRNHRHGKGASVLQVRSDDIWQSVTSRFMPARQELISWHPIAWPLVQLLDFVGLDPIHHGVE